MEENPFFGRLKHLPRKSVLHYIDTMLQQRYLELDYQKNVVFVWERDDGSSAVTDR